MRISALNYSVALPVRLGACSMRHKNKSKKDKAAYDKAIIASVTKEMARPRMTQSAQMASNKRLKPRDGVSA
jgi:hypothetical protein